MRLLTNVRAQVICGHWHGGQWSALYQFASSGEWTVDNCLQYLKETEDCLMSGEYALHPYDLPVKDVQELNAVKRFFVARAKQNKIGIEWHKNKLYGYMVPYVTDETEETLTNKIKQLLYLK